MSSKRTLTRSNPLRLLAVIALLALLGWQLWGTQRTPHAPPVHGATAPAEARALPGFLPPEAAPVIARIQRGEPFQHRQDGSVFGNREGRLPSQPRGYYREYTVPTPGLSHRGARRIVTGGDPPTRWYYTADHYESFRAFEPSSMEVAR